MELIVVREEEGKKERLETERELETAEEEDLKG